MKPPRIVLLGNPENRRVHFFAAAYREAGGEELEVVAWLDFLRDESVLEAALAGGECWLRIESPGENFEVEKALLSRGAEGREPYRRLTRRQVARLTFEHGRILPLRQWYRGWSRTLGGLERAVHSAPACRVMNAPDDIAVMFDKAECHRRFSAAAVPVPKLLGLPRSRAELMECMERHRCRRLFLKPCHSSSASGVVAFEIGPQGQQAFSSVELVRAGGELHLYNSLRVRRYESASEIAALLDAICRERCVAEAWLPKAGHAGRRFDLRVLVIAGRAAHVVVRQSAGPITNLHLGNRRGDLEELRERMTERPWQNAMSICEAAAAVMPRSLYVAVDLLVAPSLRRCAVAEVNAFGDLLPRVRHGGLESYTAELQALMAAHVSTRGW